MASKLFNLETWAWISVVLTAAAWAIAGYSDPQTQHLNLIGQWHVGIDASGADARIEFFNGNYGPYHGGIIAVSAPQGWPTKPIDAWGFGDTLGIYIRRVPMPGGGRWWTVSLSLAYFLIAALVIPIVRMMQRRGFRGKRHGFPIELSG